MEVELGSSVGQICNVVRGMVSEIGEMLVANELNQDGISIVSKDLEVLLVVVWLPELSLMVSCASIDVV